MKIGTESKFASNPRTQKAKSITSFEWNQTQKNPIPRGISIDEAAASKKKWKIFTTQVVVAQSGAEKKSIQCVVIIPI